MHPIIAMWDIKKPTFSDKDKLYKNIYEYRSTFTSEKKMLLVKNISIFKQ